jgi:transposase
MRPVEKKFSTDFKAKVALAAFKGDKTLSELEREYIVPADQIEEWKRQLIDNICKVFDEDRETLSTPLMRAPNNAHHAKIGDLIAQNDFLTKVLGRQNHK